MLIERADHDPQEAQWLAELEAHPHFSSGVTDALREDSWRAVSGRLRRAADYLRFLTPVFNRSPYLVSRAEGRAPAILVRLMRLPGARNPTVLRALMAVVRMLESALPRNAGLVREFEARRPDVVVLSPHLMPGARHSEVVRAARKLGIPSCIAVASWDNLSSKQFLHELPDVVIVWNETQKREAIEIHRVPADRIVITGAQNFDLWFNWQPRRRGEFCRRVGLDPERPYLAYLGGSLFPGELTEARFARRWVEALRTSPDETLRSVGVLLRPHPKRIHEWDSVEFGDLGEVVVWPPNHAEMPVSNDARADFFDSVFHGAAVVGLNTSALIEAAIVGRTVHTLLVPEFSSSQEGVFHFDYLFRVGGGLPVVAHSIEENLAQLGHALRGREDREAETRRRRFLSEFVRPHGLDNPATPFFVDAVERASRSSFAASRRFPLRLLPLTALLYGARLALPVIVPTARLLGAASRWMRGRLSGARTIAGTPLAPPPAIEPKPAGVVRVAFSVLTSTTLKNFETVIRSLAARGCEVEVIVHDLGRVEGAHDLLDSLAAEAGVRVHAAAGGDSDPRVRRAMTIRSVLDYLQFLDPRFHRAYRARAAKRLPGGVRQLLPVRLARRRAVRTALTRLLLLVDRLQPPSHAIREYLRRLDPDVVLFSPHIALGSIQPDFLRAARSLEIRTAVCVASWDNLTSKSLLRPLPDRLLVWNETQRREAVELHQVQPERVVITGAQCYDEWLTWAPRSRGEFCSRVGIDAARPFVLYVCFTPFKGSQREADFVLRWLRHLRASDDALVADVGVVVRPHPKRTKQWRTIDLAGFGNAAVWPHEARWPTDAASKADYFDAIHHSAAVIGINTSAMLEAGAIGRPVLTILAPEFHESQEATLHFRYLMEAGGGGLLHAARTLDEHERQLGEVLRGAGEAWAREAQGFVRAFLRPHGLDLPATPFFVDAVEELARASRRQSRAPRRRLATVRSLAVRSARESDTR